MTTHTIPTPAANRDALPAGVAQRLRQAALRRNARTAAVLAVAVSGALVSSTCLAATAGTTFVALAAWRYRQLRTAGPTDAGRS